MDVGVCVPRVLHAHGLFHARGWSVRLKNAQGILSKNLTVVTVGFLSWYMMGYALTLGEAGLWGNQSLLRTWFFQGAFCATAATIVSGAMEERTSAKGFAIHSILMTAFVYPVVAGAAWAS